MNDINTSTNAVTKSPVAVKHAIIWARVSTTSQTETSLPSQISRCRERLEKAGYCVIRILQVDWTSTDLFKCPEFQHLRSLIKNREIEALAVFDRDRLEAKGLQRLIFLSELKEAGVELVICQGPPLIEGPEGQIVELALAIGKERQVMRARQGSRDGLYDRAVKFKKPVTYHRLFGYTWDKANNRLVPNDDWPTVKLIFDMLVGGAGYHPIIQELKKRGISSPSGQPEWNKTALSNMVWNPTYAGRYFALKKQAVEPKKRKTNSYGNSSVRKLPLEQAHYLPGVEIVNPPITWEQRGRILDQLAKHQKLAQRNAKHDYLLRGMIFCETHRGKNGEPRRYHGIPKRDTYYYTCPVGGCENAYISGPWIDNFVQTIVRGMFTFGTKDDFYKTISNTDSQEKLKTTLKQEQRKLETEYEKLVNKLAQLEDDRYENKVGPDEYEQLKARYRVRKQGIKDGQMEILNQLSQLGRERDAVESWMKLRNRFMDRLLKDRSTNQLLREIGEPPVMSPALTTTEWRELLTACNFQLVVGEEDNPGLAKFAKQIEDHPYASLLRKSRLNFSLPLQTSEIISDIVLLNPEPG